MVAFFLIALLAFSPAHLGGSLRADEVTTLTATADSFLRQNAATTNSGALTTFNVSSTNAAARERGIVQFDLSSIPATAAVKTSLVRLFVTTAPNPARSNGIHRVTSAGAWVENQVTWNVRATATNWTTAGGDFNATAANAQSTGTTNGVTITYTLLGDGTVANIPQGWVDGSLTNLGLMVVDTNETFQNKTTTYASKENATAADRPQIDVHFLRDVTVGAVTPGISEVTLNFTFPAGATGANYAGALLARKPGATAPTFAPVDGTAYVVGSQPVAGETVASNAANFSASPATVAVLDENGPSNIILPSTQYSYKIYTRDNNSITGAAVVAPPHFSLGSTATSTVTTSAAGGTNKNWSYKTAGTALAPPGLDPASVVIAASNDFNVHSMNTATGARNYQPSSPIGTTGGTIQTRPAVLALGDNQIADCDSVTLGNQPCTVTYVGSNDGRVYAFNATTGQLIWATPVPGAAGSLVAVGGIIQGGIAVQLKNFANGSFTPTTDLVFVGTRELSTSANKVYGLNGSTGAIVWTFSPGNMDAVNSTPVVDYAINVIWVTSLSNGATQPSLWKISSVTGAGISNFSLGDISGSPTLNSEDRVVYAVKDNGDLVAVRNDIASCVNTFSSGATSGTGFPIPIATGVAGNENIFFTTTTGGASTVRKVNFVYNLACGGETFAAAAGYTNPSGIGTHSGPMFNPFTSFIYVGSSDGKMYKIDPAAGTVLANRTVNAGVVIGEPSFDVYLLKLYVGDAQGRIYSFDVF
jgi:outer membrane protein assembly factor BamB